MIVTVINKTTGRSFSIHGEFSTVNDICNKIEGTDNEDVIPSSCKIVNRTDGRKTLNMHDPINGGDEVELHIYPMKIDAGA